MTEPVVVDIGNDLDLSVFSTGAHAGIHVLAFHGGGGVGGTPHMLAPLAAQITTAPDISMALARYRTLTADGATFDDMRDDTAHSLNWASENIAVGQPFYLLGASFGALLALDAFLGASPHIQTRITGLILLNPVTDIGPEGWSSRVVNVADHGHLSPMARLAGHPALSRLRCFVAHGGRDDVVPITQSRRFAALWPAGRCEMVEFPNSVHGFFNRAPHNDTTAAAIRTFVAAPTERAQSASTQVAKSLLPGGATVVYGIGAQKAGTSWLYDCLGQSPECHTGPTKEQHYFNALYVEGEASHLDQRHKELCQIANALTPGPDPANLRRLEKIELLAQRLSIHATTRGDHRPYVKHLLQGYRGQRIVCDFTPAYCTLDADGFAEMASVGPAKFIFVLRDPVDRLWSQVRMAVSAEFPDLPDTKYEAKCVRTVELLMANRALAQIPRADYARTMTALEQAVPAKNIHYAFYETLFSQDSIDAISAFLGIARIPVSREKRVNLGRNTSLPLDIGVRMKQALAPQYDVAQERFGDAVPENWRRFQYAATG